MRFSLPVIAAATAATLFSATALADVAQPDMDAALRSLETAKHQIELADKTPDKEGHASKASALILQAIDEVRASIKARNEDGK
ncbi:hypothetical protein [Pararobbsia silviterrae]|uniref:DUF4398 domain-containing protein n=1 Tax=Pararobbsia silviterrae TaxID=1792498 RepID=A0A494Y8A3_9BURK|nr:hypothetical protein [Pararobbsia silviterrae]RKP58874.1 hypothetical protein D7S86_02800 [Pararobbsia silviterrae]